MMIDSETACDTEAPFWEHIEELRRTFIRIASSVLIGFLLSLFFYQQLFVILTLPLNINETPAFHQVSMAKERIYNTSKKELSYTKEESTEIIAFSPDVSPLNSQVYQIPPGGYLDIETPHLKNQLFLFGPLEGISIAIKTSFWMGLLIASPIWLYFVLCFIAPGLNSFERGLLLPFVLFSIVFISLGILFGYFITLPLANQYLELFNQGLGVNLWSVANYLDFTLIVLLGSGLAFEGGLLLFFLVHLGLFSVEKMCKKRRYAIVFSFILGALLTPPDVVTQLLFAALLIGLYEIAILYGRLRIFI